MFHYKVDSSGSVVVAEEALSEAIELWINACIREYAETLPDDNPAQAVFTSGWMPWLKRHKEHPGTEWLLRYRDAVDDHFTRTDQWFHGYWRSHEAGRGMDHFLVFLGGLWEIMPQEPVTIEMAVDAAEHLGNWNEDVPAWFDWDTGLFRSVYLGSNGPSQTEDFPYNIPMHLKGLDMALLAYRMSGQSQYLNLALAGASRWADAIVSAEAYPLALGPDGGLAKLPRRAAALYGEFLMPKSQTGDDALRAEAVLQAGGIPLLLKLWQYAREPRFIEAVERTLDLLVPGIGEPGSNALVAAIRFYRNHSGRVRYDDTVLQTTEFLFPYFIESLNVNNYERSKDDHIDAVAWRENTQARQHNPLLLGLAAEISGNERLATRSLELGSGYLELARRAFPTGRDNPLSPRTVSAVARGCGRDSGAGIVTELWSPLQQHFCADPFAKRERPSRRPFPLRLAKA